MLGRFTRFGLNPLVRLLLRSPLWRLLPAVIIVETTGRRSGHWRATPVQYIPAEPDLYVLSRRDRLWWRNLRLVAPIRVRLRGLEYPAHAEILPAESSLPDLFEGSVLAAAAARPDAVIVRFRLLDEPTTDPTAGVSRN